MPFSGLARLQNRSARDDHTACDANFGLHAVASTKNQQERNVMMAAAASVARVRPPHRIASSKELQPAAACEKRGQETGNEVHRLIGAVRQHRNAAYF